MANVKLAKEIQRDREQQTQAEKNMEKVVEI